MTVTGNSKAPLSDCGCCRGISLQTPAKIDNMPGLGTISYRVGTHSRFLASMLDRLSSYAALADLRSRDQGDFTIALLDSWAVTSDVLTFYQERIANESYLRTATERNSLLEMARLIGYELRPGVAASVYLAFTLDNLPGSPGFVTIDPGTRVQSVPGQNEKPQTFETVEGIDARAEWNALLPQLTKPQAITQFIDSFVVKGTRTGLNSGDNIIIVTGLASGQQSNRVVLEVVPDQKSQTTLINLIPRRRIRFFDILSASLNTAFSRALPAAAFPVETLPAAVPVETLPVAAASVESLPTAAVSFEKLPAGVFSRSRTNLIDDVVQSQILQASWRVADLSAYAAAQGWSEANLIANVRATIRSPPPVNINQGIYAMRKQATLFGYNAPLYDLLDTPNPTPQPRTQPAERAPPIENLYLNSWEDRTLLDDLSGTTKNANTYGYMYLDSAYPGVTKGSWIVIKEINPYIGSMILQAQSVEEVTRSDFTISAKVTRISNSAFSDSSKSDSFGGFRMRGTTVLVQSEQLDLADVPLPDIVAGDDRIVLNDFYLGLKAGQMVAVTGQRSDLQGVTVTELMTLLDVTLENGLTQLIFEKGLKNSYVRSTVTINANIALATHGETVSEIMGSGDASQLFQSLTLHQSPLTYVSALTPSGDQSTLQVRVNDILWHEVPMLYGQGPKDRIFVTRRDDNEVTSVQFGDGQTGARPPTGQNNISAAYRKGIGHEGMVKAGKITQLMSRPLGLKGVTNLLEASGAADPESLADARKNAPLTVLTLDRVVSMDDYEAFSRSFAGIAKALATWTWDGQGQRVLVTVAGTGGADVGPDLQSNLVGAMLKFGDPHVSIRVLPYRHASFRLESWIKISPDYLANNVLAAVEDSLRSQFSFDQRSFGQPVTLSEVISVIQGVPGVVAADVRKLYRVDDVPGANFYLGADTTQPGYQSAAGAELLVLDPSSILLEVMP